MDLLDDTNPDWVPSVSMGYATKEGDFDRYHRRKRREHCDDNDLNVDSIPADGGIPVDSSISLDGNVSADDSAMPSSNLDDSQLEQGSTVQLDSNESDLDFDLEGNAARLRLDNQKL